MIYLYLKTHNKTGLKYLGKTEQDPFVYEGSGVHWKRHLAKHGNDVTTEILFETDDMEEFKRVGLEYSEKWNIVESAEFANLMVENGCGGDNSHNFTDETRRRLSEAAKLRPMPDRTGATFNWSDEARQKQSIRMTGTTKTITDEERQRRSAQAKGDNNPFYGKKHSDKTIAIMKSKRAIQEPPMLGKNHKGETKRKKSESAKNRKSPSFAKAVHTPIGDFESIASFAKELNISNKAAWGLFQEGRTLTATTHKRYIGLFREEDIGTTLIDLGFYYI